MFRKRFSLSAVIALILLLLTACTNTATPAAAVQTEGDENTATVVPETAATSVMATEAVTTEAVTTEAVVAEAAISEEATPEPMAEPTDWTETATVDGDYYVLGNPGAPIRLVDYSDFM